MRLRNLLSTVSYNFLFFCTFLSKDFIDKNENTTWKKSKRLYEKDQ